MILQRLDSFFEMVKDIICFGRFYQVNAANVTYSRVLMPMLFDSTFLCKYFSKCRIRSFRKSIVKFIKSITGYNKEEYLDHEFHISNKDIIFPFDDIVSMLSNKSWVDEVYSSTVGT